MAPSIYEDLRAGHGLSDPDDVEERAGMAIDEENLAARYQDYELHDALFDGNDGRITNESTAFLAQRGKKKSGKISSNTRRTKGGAKDKWFSRSPRILDDDGDDDVPASLLIEEEEEPGGPSRPAAPRKSPKPPKSAPVPGPSTRDAQAQWASAQTRQRLHDDDEIRRTQPAVPRPGMFSANPKEKAMWMWINVTNLDRFMGEIYAYYRGAGIWCICLDRLLNILYEIPPSSFWKHLLIIY